MHSPSPTRRPIMGFLTDFGFDGAAATCRAVILGIAPDAQIVDISHAVRKFAIGDGAYLLANALPFFPVGVHLAVVDPGVGTARRPIAIRAGRGDILVGPDNGLLVPAAGRLGGMVEAREIRNREWMLPETSATFHGRDLFAPVAAHLAMGARFEDVGPALDLEALVRLPAPEPVVRAGELETVVTYVDSFGNLRLAGGPAALAEALGPLEDGAALEIEVDRRDGRAATDRGRWQRTFGEAARGACIVYRDSSANLAIAEVEGDAATRTGAGPGDRLRIRRA